MQPHRIFKRGEYNYVNNTSYSLSHKVPMAKLFDGRLALCGIVEVKLACSEKKKLWDGYNSLWVFPRDGEDNTVDVIVQNGSDDVSHILSKIAAYFSVDIFDEWSNHHHSEVPVGQTIASSDEDEGVGIRPRYGVSDGQLIDKGRPGIVETRLRNIKLSCVEKISLEIMNEKYPWLQVAKQLSMAVMLLSPDDYAVVLDETGIKRIIADRVLEVFRHWSEPPEQNDSKNDQAKLFQKLLDISWRLDNSPANSNESIEPTDETVKVCKAA